MRINHKASKGLVAMTLVLALSMLDFSVKPKSTLQTGNEFAQSLWQLDFINQANAAPGDTILAAFGGVIPRYIRMMYFLINGPGPNGYPEGTGGPAGGFLGLIRDITGPTALGGGLKASGYNICADIPATGSSSMTDSEGTFSMYFETPTKVIPTGYTGADGTAKFEKRVVVQFGGTTFMNIEFNCSNTVGWLRMSAGEGAAITSGTQRHLEVYYDTEVSSNAKLELYMTYEPGLTAGNEYFFAKFKTITSSTYKFWLIRTQDKTGDYNGFRTAVHGDSNSKIMNSFFRFEADGATPNDTGTAYTGVGDDVRSTEGDVQCLDFSTPATPVESTGCGSLALDSSAGAPIINSATGLSLNWVASAGGLKNDMTVLANPVSP
ncbi:MAG: hypothetical protein OEY52_16440 [Gammaproteobacteria bacterium]|nr:hypothetical protein [Gammaproteobacteria bacterium]